ncbi:hypothetical protein JCM11641_004071 [Rhodosporidiobolus odoratus]
MGKTVFILGTGFIGGSVLQGLLDENKYEIAALCRDDKKADKLNSLGVRPVMGTLHDDALLQKEAETADIILHVATADDKPSVESIVKGLEKRSKEKAPAIYIHTSGTGVLTVPTHPKELVFADKSQNLFDEKIPDNAPHREMDLTIKRAVESGKLNAKVSIILPPCIYGIGTGPFNRRSIQIPLYIHDAIKHNALQLYRPQLLWNNTHIKNLVTAYLTLLAHLESTTSTPPLYIIAETGEHAWREVYDIVDAELKKRNLISKDAEPQINAEEYPSTETGTQSRSKSELLHEWGWKVEKLESITESIAETIDHMQKIGEL